MSELPKSWSWSKVGNLSSLLRGVSYQKHQAESLESDSNCLVLRGGNIQNGKIFIGNDVVYVPKELISQDQYLKVGDVIIVGSTGSKELIGKAALSLNNEQKISFGAFLMLIRPFDGINKKFFGYFFVTDNYRNAIRKSSGGININNIRREHITSIPFPLPPLPEQKRIVAKLDTLFAHLDQLKARLEKIPTLLKQFRQAVLTQAVTGKLTEEWRGKISINESGEQLLGRIKKEALQQYSNKLDHHRENNLPKPKIPRGYKEGAKYEIEILTKALPKEWATTVIDKVSNVFVGSTPSRKELEYWNGDIFWVSSGEVANNRIYNTNEKITKEGLYNSSVKLLPKKSVLIAMIGEGKTRGQASILEIDACINQNIAAIVVNSKQFNSEYLWYYLLSSYEKNREQGRGGNQPALNGQKVGAISITVPPLKEQKEIVRRVESLLVLADRIEASYQSLQKKIDHLPQAILSKAFRGELVGNELKEYSQETDKLLLAAEP